MTITYTARKVTLRDNFKERVEKKLAKFQKIFSDKAEAHVISDFSTVNRIFQYSTYK